MRYAYELVLSSCACTYHPWEDWRRAVHSCLNDSQSRNSDAWAGMDSLKRCVDSGSPNPGRPVDQNADTCCVCRRNCKENEKFINILNIYK